MFQGQTVKDREYQQKLKARYDQEFLGYSKKMKKLKKIQENFRIVFNKLKCDKFGNMLISPPNFDSPIN